MIILNIFKALTFASVAAILTPDEQWRALGALSLGSLIGGAFGMLIFMLLSSAKDTPWQIYAWRFLMNLLGGLGFGSCGLWAVAHWTDAAMGPFLIVGIGFLSGWLAVGLAKRAEPILITRLTSIGVRSDPPPVNLSLPTTATRGTPEDPTK